MKHQKRFGKVKELWWIRNGNECQGLEQTLELIQSTWNDNPELNGILGFSQGARLAHLLVQCHESKDHPLHLEGLRYFLMFATEAHGNILVA